MKKIATTWTIVVMWLLVMGGTARVVVGQDDEKPKPSANLDTKSIENTALYLNRAAIKLRNMHAQADASGNYVKYNEYRNALDAELKNWADAKVTWLAQVNSIGELDGKTNKPTISFLNEYLYKNKSSLFMIISEEEEQGLGRGAGKRRNSSRGGVIQGLGGGDGVRPGHNNSNSNAEYSEAWAKSLKKMDYVVIEGKIGAVELSELSSPGVYLIPEKYSPPVANKKK